MVNAHRAEWGFQGFQLLDGVLKSHFFFFLAFVPCAVQSLVFRWWMLRARRMTAPAGALLKSKVRADFPGLFSPHGFYSIEWLHFVIHTVRWVISHKVQHLYWFSLTFLSSLFKKWNCRQYLQSEKHFTGCWKWFFVRVLNLRGYNKAVYSLRFNTWA